MFIENLNLIIFNLKIFIKKKLITKMTDLKLSKDELYEIEK